MPISTGKITTPESGIDIYINNVEYTRYALNYEFTQKDNEVQEFWIELLGISSTQRSTDIKQNIVVRFESKGQLLFKGVTERPDYQTGQSVKLTGFGAGESYTKRKLAKVTASADANSGEFAPIYENVNVSSIISEQAVNITQINIDGVDDGSEFGTGTYRGDHVSVLSILGNTVMDKGGKWWFTHGNSSPYSDNIFHASKFRGSASSVKNYKISGNEQNANLTNSETDFENFANFIEILGRGDGINQLRSVNFDATTIRSFLDSDITSSQTTINLDDASTFPSTGTAFVGMEKISYTGITDNQLTGVTRGLGNFNLIDNFEDGDFTGNPIWTSNGGVTVQSSVVKNGSNALEITAGNSASTPVNGEPLFGECWIRSTDVSNAGFTGYGFYTDTSTFIATLNINQSVFKVRTTAGTETISGTPVNDTWYRFVIFYNSGLTVASFYVYGEDGSLIASKLNKPSTGTTMNFVKVIAGAKSYYDDIVYSADIDYPGYAHSKNIEVYDSQFNTDNPQTGSSIKVNGLKQLSFQNKDIIDQDALDKIAQDELVDKKDLITRIVVDTSNPYDSVRSVNVDDAITLVDADTDLSSDFIVVSKIVKSDNGFESCRFECSNVRLSLTEEIKENRRLSDIEGRFMQGSTALITVNETENAEAGTSSPGPIDVFFEIPVEAVAINQVKLAYRNEQPRIWSDVTGTKPNDSIVTGGGESNRHAIISGSWTSINTQNPNNDGDYSLATATAWTEDSGTNNVNNLSFRVNNSTDNEFYPSETGSFIGRMDNSDDDAWSGAGTILIPKNLNSKTLELELKTSNDNITFETTTSFSIITPHTHEVDYNISGQAYTTSAIRIYTTNNADGTPVWTERTLEISGALGRSLRASDENIEQNIDLTTYFSSTGWKGVRVATNGNSRHKVNVFGKVFIEARKTA